MQKSCPDKEFIPAPPETTDGGTLCGCNECNYMRLNTLEKVYNCLRYEYPQVEVDAAVAAKAIKPIERMLALSEDLKR
jgi:quinolinate synthase